MIQTEIVTEKHNASGLNFTLSFTKKQIKSWAVSALNSEEDIVSLMGKLSEKLDVIRAENKQFAEQVKKTDLTMEDFAPRPGSNYRGD